MLYKFCVKVLTVWTNISLLFVKAYSVEPADLREETESLENISINFPRRNDGVRQNDENSLFILFS